MEHYKFIASKLYRRYYNGLNDAGGICLSAKISKSAIISYSARVGDGTTIGDGVISNG